MWFFHVVQVSPIVDAVSQETSLGYCEVVSDPTSTRAALLDMHNSQHTATTVSRVAPCFHHRGTTGCSAIPELPPWLQHCYTTGQMSGGESAQQGSQHFHQSATYLTHDGSIVQGDR